MPRFDGNNLNSETSSVHDHTFVGALGSYRNKPFITGGYAHTQNYNVKTEIYDQNSNQWIPALDFRYSKSW